VIELDDGFNDVVGDVLCEPDATRALETSRAIVSAEVEQAVDNEVAQLRATLSVLETRILGAARVVERMSQASLAGRMQLEEEVSKAAVEADGSPGDESTRRVKSLGVLLKILRTQEELVASAVKLLREPAALDEETLLKLSTVTE